MILCRFFLPVLLCLSAGLPAQTSPSRVDALLREMSLEEKVGQMTQLDLSVLVQTDGAPGRDPVLDPNKIAAVIEKRFVGSILNASNIAHRPEQWQEIINALQDAAQKTRAKIPLLYGVDSIHGANYVRGATLFPQALNLAATFDPELVRAISRVTAKDTRAVGIPWNFAPVVDVGRTPLWSRFFETSGEDVLLCRRLGQAAILGLQGNSLKDDDAVASCLKHFIGYSAPRTGRDRTPAWIPERQLREIFLPPFADGVKAKSPSVMVNSGDIAGLPLHADRRLLTDVLRGELGFEGVIVTDWQDVQKLVEIHRVAEDDGAAVRLAIDAGIDMAMVPLDFRFTDAVLREVKAGRIQEARIDASVRRILALKDSLGLFETPKPKPEWLARIGLEEDRALSLQAAKASLVLLKNEAKDEASAPVLPFKELKRLLVLGPAASSVPMLHGGWTWTWQGKDPAAYPAGVPSLIEGLRRQFGEGVVRYRPEARGLSPSTAAPGIFEGLALQHEALQADAILVVLGEEPAVEKPGDIDSLELSTDDIALLRSAVAVGRPVVLVTLFARPFILHPHAEGIAAHLHAGLPGPFGAEAIAAVLAGLANPEGRLPFTWPKGAGALITDDHVTTERLDPQFGMNAFQPQYAFGSGLSYTQFALSALTLEKDDLLPTEALRFSVRVENTGQRAGTETVLAFVRDEVASITPAHRRLRDFARVSLEAGASQVLRFEIPVSELAFVGIDNRFVLEPGQFTLMVGSQSLPFRVRNAR